MDNHDNWQRASLSSFSLNKDGPYLDGGLTISSTQSSYNGELEKGYQEGLKKAQLESNEHKDNFQKLIQAIENTMQIFDDDMVDVIKQLSVSISKQVIRRELQTNSDQVVSVVKEAIKLLPIDDSRLMIHLNPNDINVLKKVFNQDDIASSYSLIEDPSIQRGGCKLATDDSIIDATIDSQIAQISANILGSQRTMDRNNE
jgi:flagellar assembly protein FliH